MKKISLGKICDNFVTIKIIENRDIMGIEYEILDNKLIIKVRERYFYMNGSFIECFIQKINIYFKSVFLNENDEIIIEKKEQGNYMIEEKYKLFLENLRNHSYSSRFLIPCQIKYSKIRLKEKINFDKMSTCGLNSYFSVPIMLSPFVVIINKDERKEVKIRINDKLTDWVYDNRFDEKVTKEEIKNTYDDFIKEFKEIVIQ